ncbi:hypothetical protein ABEW05_010035 [Botrytis cinerea]
MAARRTPGPSVGSLCSTFLAPVSTEQSIPKVYVDFEKEYRQLVIRNTELSDANRKFKCNMSNHRRAYEATPFSSSGSSVVLIGLASPTSTIDEPFFEQLSSIKKDMGAKIRSWDGLAAGNEKLFPAAKYTNAMEYAELAVERVIKTRNFAHDMENGDYEIPEMDLGQRFYLQNVFGRRFGFGAYC